MAKAKGTDFNMFIDSSIIGGQRSFDYSLTGNLAETTDIDDGDWTSFLPTGGKKLEGTLDAFMLASTDSSRNFKYLMDAWIDDVSLGVMYAPVSGAPYLKGAVWVNDVKVSNGGSNADIMAFTVSFTGTGKFVWA
jgi:hypothetical protein